MPLSTYPLVLEAAALAVEPAAEAVLEAALEAVEPAPERALSACETRPERPEPFLSSPPVSPLRKDMSD